MYTFENVLDAIRDAHESGVTEGVLVLHPIAHNDLRQSYDWDRTADCIYGYRYRVDPDAELAIELVSAT